MKLTFLGVENIPMVEPGDDVAALIVDAVHAMGEEILADDVLVVAQKIVSKSENRYLDLATVTPSPEAEVLAVKVDKDARKVQAILDESNEVVRTRLGVLIVEHKLGFVQANAGIDQSNISHEGDEEDMMCLLLPEDPDKSAKGIKDSIKSRLGVDVGVIINDSLGRAWRNGTVGLAIGVAGFTALENYIGDTDLYGRELVVTVVAAADEMAAGASLVMGQTSQKTPVVLVRGYKPRDPEETERVGYRILIRNKEFDLFR